MRIGETLYRPYFLFNGVNSLDMGVVVTSMPSVYKPAFGVKTMKIPGRDGALHIEDGGLSNYTKTVECAVVNRRNIDQISCSHKASADPKNTKEHYKIYLVRVDNQISIGQMLKVFQRFQVNFDAYPLKYSVNREDQKLTITKPAKLYNPGTYYSQPLLTVYGQGTATLEVNQQSYGLTGLNGCLTIDSYSMEVYQGKENKNHCFTGVDFPLFQIGENDIRFTSQISKIEIDPRWRWI